MISTTLLGNLGGDPETRDGRSGGSSFTTFRVASTRKDRNGDKATTWISVTLFGARGEAFARFHRKGDRVFVQGELYEETWTDRDNQERVSLKLDASTWAFAKDSDQAQGDGDRGGRSSGGGRQGDRGGRGSSRGGSSRGGRSSGGRDNSRDEGRQDVDRRQEAPDDDIPF